MYKAADQWGCMLKHLLDESKKKRASAADGILSEIFEIIRTHSPEEDRNTYISVEQKLGLQLSLFISISVYMYIYIYIISLQRRTLPLQWTTLLLCKRASMLCCRTLLIHWTTLVQCRMRVLLLAGGPCIQTHKGFMGGIKLGL